jgi:hypothetical protein
METILTVALGTIFPKENIKSIMEVISATPNPDIATQILLGIYEEPVIQSSAVYDDRDCYFISYNKWDDQVQYSYMIKDSKHIYVKKGTDTSLINENNYEEFSVSYHSDNAIGYRVALSTLVEVKSHMYSNTWNSKPMVEKFLGTWEETREINVL